jgi:hypothetical protein
MNGRHREAVTWLLGDARRRDEANATNYARSGAKLGTKHAAEPLQNLPKNPGTGRARDVLVRAAQENCEKPIRAIFFVPAGFGKAEDSKTSGLDRIGHSRHG